jgi:hypothetical protein
MKITFFTTSTYSDIQAIQSMCIKKHFPDSEHIIIDGKLNWHWYEWLEISKNIDSDWYVHIDEDCFITSNKGIYNLIEEMITNNYDISGPPDGHYEYRSGNHMAFNSFFMIMNKKSIDTWINRINLTQFKKEWIEPYQFEIKNQSHYEYNMEFGSSGKNFSQIWKPNTEPYYDFMWVLKDNGIKFNYLEPKFGEEFQTTNLLDNTVIHMWHQRQRDINHIVSPLHKIRNKTRFDNFIKTLI